MTTSSFLQGDLASFRKAVATNNKESIEKHLSHMKNISQTDLNQALFTCIDNFRIDEQTDECLFLLLRNKANPNCEINGITPLIAACKTAQITLVKNLIENGAKPDLCNSEGKHPLQFILCSRKENYDVADYLISMMGSVNIDVGKVSVLVVAVQKEFFRIFKMLIDKGANLMINDETILHIIMKRKFKDNNKKKRFLKELVNRWQLTLIKDKYEKIPVDYENDPDIKNYYQEIFKPKVKILEKEHHLRIKQKDNMSPNMAAKDKELKKKQKQQQQKAVPEQEGVEEQQNDEESYSPQLTQQIKEKIVEVIEEQEEQKKVDDEKQKYKKYSSKILNPTGVINSKKILKPILKNPVEKSVISDRSTIFQKQKPKKVVNDKKKKQFQPNQKKNKSFSGLTKKSQADEEKKEEQKKKTSARSSFRQEDSKKINRKQSDIKLEKVSGKVQDEDKKHQQLQMQVRMLTIQQKNQINILLNNMVYAVDNILEKVQEKVRTFDEQLSSDQESIQKYDYSLEKELTSEIIECLMIQQSNYDQAKPRITQIMTYLQNKMKLCLQSHIQHEFTLKMGVYGSQATALSIFQSDLDLLVMTSQNPTELINMFDSFKIFKQQQIKEVKFIKGASMPVIKLVMSQQLYNYKVDITFQLREHTGLRCAELVEEFKSAEPLLKPLVIILKQIIYAYNLADPYTGGLGSYSLTLMVIALLQLTQSPKNKENIGSLFLQFLYFYGFGLDYVCQAIIVHPPISGFDYKPYFSIYQLPNTMDHTPKLVIYDPLNPNNNVGRTTYRIECLQKLFRIIYLRLKSENLSISEILKPQFMDLIHELS